MSQLEKMHTLTLSNTTLWCKKASLCLVLTPVVRRVLFYSSDTSCNVYVAIRHKYFPG